MSLRQIKARPHQLTGRGMAIAGLVLGILMLGLVVLLVAVGNGTYEFNTN